MIFYKKNVWNKVLIIYNKFRNQSKIQQLLTLSNSSITLFTQTVSQSDKVNMLRTSERCAGQKSYEHVCTNCTLVHTVHHVNSSCG